LDLISISLDSVSELEATGYRIATLATEQFGMRIHGAYAPQGTAMPTADVRVRKALWLAINRDEIGKVFFYGKMGPAGPPMLSDPNISDVDITYWRDYYAKQFPYDPEQAKQLLKEAGYPNGFNIRVYSYAMATAPYLPKVNEVIQGYWIKIGVKAELYPIDYGAFSAIRNEMKSTQVIGTISGGSVGLSPASPTRLRNSFHSLGTMGFFNKAFPEIDKALDDAGSETDTAKRKEILVKAIKTVVDSGVYYVIGDVPTVAALGPQVDIAFPKGAQAMGLYYDIAKHRQ